MSIKTNWSNLSSPYVCGLLATNPSQYSACLHNAGYKALNLNFAYHAFKLTDLKIAIEAMQGMGFRGYSVTIPFKEEAIKFLDTIDATCLKIGAVNTIVNNGSQLFGFNTDWLGIRNSLLEVKSDYSQSSALIVGAGGAAKAAIYTLKKMNFSSITVCNRTSKRAKETAQEFEIQSIETSKVNSKSISNFDVIINSTPQNHIEFFPYHALTEEHIIFEMITSETELTKISSKVNAKVIHGIRMLLHQGLEQFKLFTEKQAPIDIVEKELFDFYNNKN